MPALHILHIGQYRHPEKNRQTVQSVFLSFYVQGLLWSGERGAVDPRTDQPCFRLRLPGDVFEFEFGPQRENWVIQLQSPDFRPTDPPSCVEIRFEEQWITVPRVVPVDRHLVPGWRTEFFALREWQQSPVPRNRFAARLGVLNLLRQFLAANPLDRAATPAQALKALIDEDETMERTLEEMSRRVGLSSDHLRRLFEDAYQTTPQAYRAERQMARVMDLIANSRLSLKEIAAATGFRYASHLSSRFRARYGITPRDGVSRFRYGGA